MIDLRNTPLADQWWRLCNLYTIRDKRGRLIPFVPNVHQTKYYKARHLLNHIGKARQLGLSTFEKLLDLDAMLFPSGDSVIPPSPNGLRIGHIDVTIEDAKKKLRMIADAYDHLDNADLHPRTADLGRMLKAAIPITSRAKEAIEFANGSAIWVGTSLRGSTPQKLSISELGKIAYFFPRKAEEIRSGALNTIAPGNAITIESTHEGGEAGLHYELLQTAIANGAHPSEIDFRFHFFPWWDQAEYVLDATFQLRPHIAAYFQRLEAQLGRTFTMGQKRWYDRTEDKQKAAMKKEYPSTPGEMFEAANQFAIYGREFADLNAMTPPRVLDFGLEALPPCFTAWDIGMSDYTAIWAIQPLDRFFLVFDWFEASGFPARVYADKIREWESKWTRNFAGHFLPHDASAIRPGEGKSFAQYLEEAGTRPIHIVPRVPDVWIGIGHVRDILPHCYFHKTFTDTPIERDGVKHPSGLACLRGYHKETNIANKTLREMPAHDQFSHSADAFRTFAEAHARGMTRLGPANNTFRAVGHASAQKFRARR